ncbi:hypothetical protein [Aequorivita flava]|uniref:hypothetical protein n=1 Tax=Aequorivita flava TaxID=3114371 RepID=UPI00316ACD53
MKHYTPYALNLLINANFLQTGIFYLILHLTHQILLTSIKKCRIMQNSIQISSEFRITLYFLLIFAVSLAVIYGGYRIAELIWNQLAEQIALEINRWSVASLLSQ